jgi:hypothetical protein
MESARRNNRLATLRINPGTESIYDNRLYNGGFANRNSLLSSSASSEKSSNGSQSINFNELNNSIKTLSATLKKGIKATVPKYGTSSLTEAMDDIAAFKSKVYNK